MAATTKLIVYNDVLREIGTAPLANLTTANTRLYDLELAFPQAVEYCLSMEDWNFARRRTALTGVADTSFPPYTYRYTRPSDYLRKTWLRLAADDEAQIDHAESGAVIYAFETTALLEYISDHADSYEPANWPPQFTRMVTLWLAILVAPKLGRTGDDEVAKVLGQKFEAAAEAARRQEALWTSSVQIPAARLPVMRRAIEILGQQLAGSISINSSGDKLRWQMNRGWTRSIRYLLEQAEWKFALKRARFYRGEDGEAVIEATDGGLSEGYSFGPASDTEIANARAAGFTYAYALPADFIAKVWVKQRGSDQLEIPYEIVRGNIYTNYDPTIMQYIAGDDATLDPANWPPTFLEAVAAYLALTVAPEVVVDEGRGKRGQIKSANISQRLEAFFRTRLLDAKTKSAIQRYPQAIPVGSFVRARRGARGGFAGPGTYNEGAFDESFGHEFD
jgi:hypothetical protein